MYACKFNLTLWSSPSLDKTYRMINPSGSVQLIVRTSIVLGMVMIPWRRSTE